MPTRKRGQGYAGRALTGAEPLPEDDPGLMDRLRSGWTRFGDAYKDLTIYKDYRLPKRPRNERQERVSLPPELDSIVNGNFAQDTLLPFAPRGHQPVITEGEPRHENSLAAILQSRDSIYFNPNRLTRTMPEQLGRARDEHTLTHEIGHVMSTGRPDANPWDGDYVRRRNVISGVKGFMGNNVRTYRELESTPSNSYAATDPEEYWASTFAEAVQFARRLVDPENVNRQTYLDLVIAAKENPQLPTALEYVVNEPQFNRAKRSLDRLRRFASQGTGMPQPEE